MCQAFENNCKMTRLIKEQNQKPSIKKIFMTEGRNSDYGRIQTVSCQDNLLPKTPIRKIASDQKHK